MQTLNNPVARLKQMLTLEERRAALEQELDSLVAQLDSLRAVFFESGASAVSVPKKTVGSAGRSVRRRGRRGALKETIMAALERAGSMGVKVKELAAEMGAKPVNIHSWFHAALKRSEDITKLRGGHYRLATARTAAGAQPAPSSKVARAGKGARKGTKRGQLTATIREALKECGSAGSSVSDLARKLGANYKNIYIWFATTGKKHSDVKKIGPATYSLAS